MENKEYIERGALIAELQEELDFYPLLHTREYNDGFSAGLKRALRLVKSQTAADVVEVVRCKDCKYYKHFKGLGNWCHRRIRSDIEYHTKATDFCSYGERKEQT